MKLNGKTQEAIVYSLHRKSYYNKRHTPIEFVCKRLSSIPCKKIRKEIKNLAKERIIIFKKTEHGIDVKLNVKMKNEIEKIVGEKMDKLYDF